MNFDDAIRAHVAWKMRLTSYIKNPDGSIKISDIEPDNICVLGKWIYGEGKDFSSFDEFKTLKDYHTQFHKCAADIVRKADAGEKMIGEITLGADSEYAKLSSEIVDLIMTMRRKINK